MINQEEYWTREQAAKVLHKKPQTLAAWVTAKRYPLPYIKIGRSVLYKPADVIALAESGLVGGNS